MVKQFNSISTLMNAVNKNPNIDNIELCLKNVTDADLTKLPKKITYLRIHIKESNISVIPQLKKIHVLKISSSVCNNLTINNVNSIELCKIFNKIKTLTLNNCPEIFFKECHSIEKMNFNNVKRLYISESIIDYKKIPAGNYERIHIEPSLMSTLNLNKNISVEDLMVSKFIIDRIPPARKVICYNSVINAKSITATQIILHDCKVVNMLKVDCDDINLDDTAVNFSQRSIVRKSFLNNTPKSLNNTTTSNMNIDFLSKHPLVRFMSRGSFDISKNKKISVSKEFSYYCKRPIDLKNFIFTNGLSLTCGFRAGAVKNIPDIAYNHLEVSFNDIQNKKNIIANTIFIRGDDSADNILTLDNIITSRIEFAFCSKQLTINAKNSVILNGLGSHKIKFIDSTKNTELLYCYGIVNSTEINNYSVQKFEFFQNNPYFKGYVITDGIASLFTDYKKIKDNNIFINKYNREYTVIDRNGVSAHAYSIKNIREDLKYKYRRMPNSQYSSLSRDTTVSRELAIEIYRDITRACRAGIDDFISTFDHSQHRLANAKSLTIQDIIDITVGHYGNTEFSNFFKK